MCSLGQSHRKSMRLKGQAFPFKHDAQVPIASVEIPGVQSTMNRRAPFGAIDRCGSALSATWQLMPGRSGNLRPSSSSVSSSPSMHKTRWLFCTSSRYISWRVLHPANADVAEVLRTPECLARRGRMLGPCQHSGAPLDAGTDAAATPNWRSKNSLDHPRAKRSGACAARSLGDAALAVHEGRCETPCSSSFSLLQPNIKSFASPGLIRKNCRVIQVEAFRTARRLKNFFQRPNVRERPNLHQVETHGLSANHPQGRCPNRAQAADVYQRYRQPFLKTVPGARTKNLLVRDEDVQVLHTFDSIDNAQAYLASALFQEDVVTALQPLLTAAPDVRIYAAA